MLLLVFFIYFFLSLLSCQVFKLARADARVRYQVYIASAMIELAGYVAPHFKLCIPLLLFVSGVVSPRGEKGADVCVRVFEHGLKKHAGSFRKKKQEKEREKRKRKWKG